MFIYWRAMMSADRLLLKSVIAMMLLRHYATLMPAIIYYAMILYAILAI